MHRTVITGGGGFLGRRLALRLLDDGFDGRLTITDQAPLDDKRLAADQRVELLQGDVADPAFLDRLLGPDVDRVIHLASVVSAGAEADFDLGYTVNLRGTLSLLERCRTLSEGSREPVRVLFASSLATYGSSQGRPVDDSTSLRPETSYGVQKASCELLINDYSRKGFIDGRTLRLPTVVVRPGAPNRAASGFASGIIREPLSGIDMVCPVHENTVMAVISPRRVIDAFVTVDGLAAERFGPDRTVLLPGLAMSMTEAVAATETEGAAAGIVPGHVRFEPDPAVQRIIDSWPPETRSDRAHSLGLVGDSSVAAIVRQHIEDELVDRGSS